MGALPGKEGYAGARITHFPRGAGTSLWALWLLEKGLHVRVVTVQASISYLLLPTTTGLVSVCPPVLTHITCHARVIGKAGACGTLISCDAEVYQPLLMVAFNPDSCKLFVFFYFVPLW